MQRARVRIYFALCAFTVLSSLAIAQGDTEPTAADDYQVLSRAPDDAPWETVVRAYRVISNPGVTSPDLLRRALSVFRLRSTNKDLFRRSNHYIEYVAQWGSDFWMAFAERTKDPNNGVTVEAIAALGEMSFINADKRAQEFLLSIAADSGRGPFDRMAALDAILGEVGTQHYRHRPKEIQLAVVRILADITHTGEARLLSLQIAATLHGIQILLHERFEPNDDALRLETGIATMFRDQSSTKSLLDFQVRRAASIREWQRRSTTTFKRFTNSCTDLGVKFIDLFRR